MKPLSIALALAALGASSGERALRPLSYPAALATAKHEAKPLVLVFLDPAEAESAKLDPVWRDPKVRAWLEEKAVAIAVDTQKQRAVAERHRIYTAPAVVIQSPLEVELDVRRGPFDAKSFLEFASASLSEEDTATRLGARLAGRETDPWLRLDLASALHDQGRSKEALAEYLWCWDSGVQADPGFAPARSGAVLEGWTRLARIHPAANEAAGDRVRSRCLELAASPETGARLDETLELATRFRLEHLLLGAYDELGETETPDAGRAGREALRARLAPHVVLVLFRERRWEDALAALGDPEREIERRIAEHAASLARASPLAEGSTEADAARSSKADVLQFGADCCQAALGAGNAALAQRIVDRLLAFQNDAGTYAELIRRARRAGAARFAVALLERGLASELPPDAKLVLRDSTDTFPRLK